jgi:hypothetical protein
MGLTEAAKWRYGIKLAVTTERTWDLYQKAWMDDREITWEDADEILAYTLAMGLIWGPELAIAFGVSATPLLVIEGIVVAGFVASAAIGGVKGAENYMDFITEPGKYYERTQFAVETIYEHKIKEPLVAAANWYVDKVDDIIEAFRLGWSITQPQPLW